MNKVNRQILMNQATILNALYVLLKPKRSRNEFTRELVIQYIITARNCTEKMLDNDMKKKTNKINPALQYERRKNERI